jgi:hypothetical protein
MSNRIAEFETGQLPAGAWWPAGGHPGPGEWQREAQKYLHQATEWVKQNPEIALGCAVAIGVVMGWFIKRR